MTFRWRSLGRIYYTATYGQCPTPLVMDDRVRVFFSERDADNRSFIRYADLDIDNLTKILRVGDRVLGSGKLGAADADGQIPSFAWRSDNGLVHLYYSGWTALKSGAYHNCTMLASSRDGGHSFERVNDGPILDRTAREPYLAVTPCVINPGRFYEERMWYVGGLRWEMIEGKPEPIYVIHTARPDGDSLDAHWLRDGIALPQEHPLECHSRPYVVKDRHRHHLFFSYRSAVDYRDGKNAYRIGCATSSDGLRWLRSDRACHIERGDWDTTMQAYPALFEAGGDLFMLFNGSTFGKHGFGLAVAE